MGIQRHFLIPSADADGTDSEDAAVRALTSLNLPTNKNRNIEGLTPADSLSTQRRQSRPAQQHRILDPSNHHFIIGRIAPANCFRGVGVVWVLRRIIEMRGDD